MRACFAVQTRRSKRGTRDYTLVVMGACLCHDSKGSKGIQFNPKDTDRHGDRLTLSKDKAEIDRFEVCYADILCII